MDLEKQTVQSGWHKRRAGKRNVGKESVVGAPTRSAYGIMVPLELCRFAHLGHVKDLWMET